MAESKTMPVKELNLDLRNYRTLPQAGEAEAIKALASIRPEWFWELVRSIIDNGYLLLENILVLESPQGYFTVKEGNRRVAALKIILGHVPRDIVAIPPDIVQKLAGLTNDWVANNSNVPCTIFSPLEEPKVRLTVSLAHGKDERAGRLRWESVATARHNRDENNGSEPALDLLEKYLKSAGVPSEKVASWAGIYNLTVLTEAMQKMANHFGAKNAPEIAAQYPSVTKNRASLERIMWDIGEEKIGFEDLRPVSDGFLLRYGLSPSSGSTGASVGGGSAEQQSGQSSGEGGEGGEGGAGVTGAGGTQSSAGGSVTQKKAKASALYDPRSVKNALRNLKIVGPNREKVVVLREEARKLDLKETPLAFCFLLRSMFEISAKAYCLDHQTSGGPSATKNGKDRPLIDVLRDVVNHLTNGGKDKAMEKRLHGSIVELGKSDGILSVTSMNQLVHNPSFSVTVHDICIVFHNVFPLLEEMNR